MKTARIDQRRWLLNGSDGGVAATLKTSNHREKNITFPRGGRGEMGVLEYESDTTAGEDGVRKENPQDL